MAQSVDLLVTHAHLLTMRGEGVGYVRDGAVAVRGDSIVDVGPSAELAGRYEAAEEWYARALEVDPDYLLATFHHGWVLRQLNRLPRMQRPAVTGYETTSWVSPTSSRMRSGLRDPSRL